MKGSQAAARFAQSLFDFAAEQKALEAVRSDMEMVATLCNENRDLELMLRSPIMAKALKTKALIAIFEGKVSTVSMQFMTLVTNKGREAMLGKMASAFVAIYNQRHGIVTAEVTTAAALSEEQRLAISAKLKSLGKEVKLAERVDPSLLGGMKVKVGDQRVDATLRKKLNEIKQDIHTL